MLRRFLILALLATPAIGVAKATSSAKKSEKITIKAVRFVGVKNVPEDELKAVLVNKKSSFFGVVAINGKYNATELKNEPMRLRDVYYQHGYLDARVSRPKFSVDPATSEATVTYHVQEGLPYNTSRVRIVKRNDVDTASIARKLKLRSGKRFNVQMLREDIRTITRDVGNTGHAFVQVQPRFSKNARNRTISIVYFIKPGRSGVIGNIRVHGNAKTKDSVVRSYIALAPGDRFNMDNLLKTREELMRTGFFESVDIRPVAARNGRIDLDVNVKEDKTGSIMGAAGYDSMEGLFVEGSYSEKNVFGSGITAGLSASYSKLKKNGTLSFDDPRVAGTMFGLYGGLFYTTTEDNVDGTYGFDKKELGGYLGIRRRITSELSGSIDYNYNDVRYSDVNTTKFPTGLKNYIKSSIGLSLTYNNTDNFYVPRKGVYAKARVEYAGLGSGADFAKYLKGSLKFAAYYGLRDLTGYDLILRYKMQGNYIKDLGFTPEAERLHLGGYYNGVRGYRSASIHPAGGGGLMSMVNSLELSVPISEKNKIRLTGFVDYGMIGNSKLNEVVKKSVGAQIEWRSPMGDVNFVLAKAIGAKPEDKTSSFEFTIGKEF
jgi:outer membrane protein insertion porin family